MLLVCVFVVADAAAAAVCVWCGGHCCVLCVCCRVLFVSAGVAGCVCCLCVVLL